MLWVLLTQRTPGDSRSIFRICEFYFRLNDEDCFQVLVFRQELSPCMLPRMMLVGTKGADCRSPGCS